MKILHVFDVTLPVVAGYTTRSKYILQNQKKLGLDPIAISSLRQQCHQDIVSEDGNVPSEVFDGITYYRAISSTNAKSRKKGLLNDFLEIFAFSKYIDLVIKKENPDVIHAHSPILTGFAGYKSAKKHNLPYVYEVRAFWEDAAVAQGKVSTFSLRYSITRWLETILLKKSDAVVTICDGLKSDILQRTISENKVFVVPNCVDSNRFLPLEKDNVLSKKFLINAKTVIGYIGTLYNFEGLEILVQAMGLMKERDDILCIIIGYGESEEKIKSLIHANDLSKKILFLGKVPHENITSFYSIVDIFIYPRVSRRITELVTPLKPLEAMSMEKAVIASDVGGLKELITENKSALLFRAGNSAHLAEKIMHLANNRELIKNLGQAAREEIIRKRDWKKTVSKYLEVYKRAINIE